MEGRRKDGGIGIGIGWWEEGQVGGRKERLAVGRTGWLEEGQVGKMKDDGLVGRKKDEGHVDRRKDKGQRYKG